MEQFRKRSPERPSAVTSAPLFLRSFGLSSLEDLPPIADEAETSEKEDEAERQEEIKDQQSLFDGQ